MKHIDKISIGRFRGVTDLELDNLGHVNLLVGGNNSGKTTVLEAIDVQCHPIDILKFVTISKKRDSESVKLPTLDSLQWMFQIRKKNTESYVFEMEDIRINSRCKGIDAETIVSCKETKVFETRRHLGGGWFRSSEKIPIDKLGDDINIVMDAKTGQLELDFGQYVDENVPMEREVKAFDITMNYNSSSMNKQNEEADTLSESFTITNFSMIRRGEKGFTAFPTELVTPIDHRSLPINSEAITQTILSGEEFKILELLKLFDDDIKEIKVLSPDGKIPVPYLVHNKLGHAPISIFGDGIRRALTLAAAVIKSRNGILLIDEIETAVHVRALKKVFSWLVNACEEYNVQLFATTHSLEAVDSIRAWYKSKKKENKDQIDANDLVTFKLMSKGNKTTVKRLSVVELAEIRDDFGLDVR